MQKNIFHIHTHICKHSSNYVDEIVALALKSGYKKLYFTEHCPVAEKCPYQIRRASYEEIAGLKKEIEFYRNKYKNKLKIYFGYEIEYNKANKWYFQLLAHDPYCEFLIFGNHFLGDLFKMDFSLPLVMNYCKTKKQLQEYDRNSKEGMASGLMSWVAHPDIYLNAYRKWDSAAKKVANNIIMYARKYKLPLGFNVNFSDWNSKSEWHYPCKYFWQLVAKTNVPVIIESDSHDIHTLQPGWLAKAKKLAISWGLKKNLTENIKLVKLQKK